MGDVEQRQWSPWRHLRVHHPEIAVHETELPDGLMGCLDHAARIIWLDSRLTQAERRCTLAHELGHLELDVVTRAGRVKSAAECKVDAWAARRLITPAELASAMRWSPYIAEMAEELWVDEHTVRTRMRVATDEEQDMLMAVIHKLGRGVAAGLGGTLVGLAGKAVLSSAVPALLGLVG